MGSLAGSSWAHLTLPAVVVGIAFLFFSTQYRVFNAMMMGDEAALTLGIPLRFYWYLYVAIVAVLTAYLGINLWNYRLRWSYYPTFGEKLGWYKLQKTFSDCYFAWCSLCCLGRCSCPCFNPKC